MQSDQRVRLRDIAREKGASFRYEYDFGDGWMHLITVEEMWPRTDLHLVPGCIEGARACPVRQRIAEASGAMRTCGTGVIPNTGSYARGRASISIQSCFPCKQLTQRWRSSLRLV
jgi:hypothetical protein